MASKIFGMTVSGGTSSKTDVRGYEDDPIIHEPDHLYVANENNVTIPAFTGKEETVTIYAGASTILDVYSLEVLGLKGTKNIEKVDAFITGQIVFAVAVVVLQIDVGAAVHHADIAGAQHGAELGVAAVEDQHMLKVNKENAN